MILKKKFLLSIIVLTCLLSGCTHKSAKNDITITSPFVISHNMVALNDGSTVFINVEMVKGQYTFIPGPDRLQGNNWTGDYQVRVYTDEFDLGSVLYLAPITANDIGSDTAMDFSQPFSLVFDDYNGDGNPDFTMGQYGAGNWDNYALFTINAKGEVSLLDTGGTLLIGQRDYSIKLDKLSSDSFQTEMYVNGDGKTEYTTYTWSGNSFVKN
ncbi:MAG: hypothetical protein FWC55_03060 [Firmicutes bacterium]|nr:hypothetical protein [Bacillota bacterium]